VPVGISASESGSISRAPGSGRSRLPLSASTHQEILRLVRRRPTGPHGDDLFSGGRRCLEGGARGRRLILRRHGGDRDRVRTMASRSTVTASSAIHHASARLRDKVFAIAAHYWSARRPISNCATAVSASLGYPARQSASRRWRKRRGPVGRTPARKGSSRPRGDPLLATADGHLELCRTSPHPRGAAPARRAGDPARGLGHKASGS
jgi:hypothetical protein